jgi:hypothetical protein
LKGAEEGLELIAGSEGIEELIHMKEASVAVWLMDIDLQTVGPVGDIAVNLETMYESSTSRGKVIALSLSTHKKTSCSRHPPSENLSVFYLEHPTPDI